MLKVPPTAREPPACHMHATVLGSVVPLEFRTRERPYRRQESDLDSGIPFLGLDLQPDYFETLCKLLIL